MGKLLNMMMMGLLCVTGAYSQTTYHVSPAYVDPYLTGDRGGDHDFWVSKPEGNLFHGYQEWVFTDNTGIAVLKDDTLRITGHIVPRANYSTCWNYDVDILFSKTSAPANPQKELADSAYVPKGPVDPSTWKFYSLVAGSWQGAGCNTNDRIQFSGTEQNMPMQLGSGANGKNGQFGLSVWLTYGYIIVDINVNLTPQTTIAPTQPPTYPPTQPPTIAPTQPPCSCDKVKCPDYHHCEIQGDKAVCVHDKTNPPTYPPTYPPTQPPCSCDKVKCPDYHHCEIQGDKAVCVHDKTNPPTQPPTQPPLDCSNIQCPPGYHCEVNNGHRQCVCDATNPPTQPPTIAPTYPPKPPCSCDKVRCPEGHHCEIQGDKAVCVCDENRPTHRPTHRPERPTHKPHRPHGCRPDSCRRGEKCICVRGKVYCIPKTTCEQVRCPRKYHCEANRRGQVFCVPDCPKLRCSQIGCPENHRCVERFGELHCLYVKPVPLTFGNFNDDLASIGYRQSSVEAAIEEYERERSTGNRPTSGSFTSGSFTSGSFTSGLGNTRRPITTRTPVNNNRPNLGDDYYDGVELGFGDGGF